MANIYEATLRSKKKEPNGMIPREFGGMESGGFSYRFDSLIFQCETDAKAKKHARQEAQKLNMVLIKLVKELSLKSTSAKQA